MILYSTGSPTMFGFDVIRMHAKQLISMIIETKPDLPHFNGRNTRQPSAGAPPHRCQAFLNLALASLSAMFMATRQY